MAIQQGQTAQASDFTSASQGASSAGKVAKLDANGLMDASFVAVAFGDGSDGDVTISSPTTLTRDMFYNNLTVNSVLTTVGFRIFIKGTISGNGSITWGTPNNGANAFGANNNSQGGGGGGITSAAGFFGNLAGGNGGNGGANASGATGGSVGNASPSIGAAGAVGGAGGTGYNGGGNGGSQPSVTLPVFRFGILRSLTVLCVDCIISGSFAKLLGSQGGNGGGGGGSNGTGAAGGGGGGGASGGTTFVAASLWAGSFTISNPGGNGGNGGNGSTNANYGGGGGGAGGSGGVSIVIYKVKTWAGTYNLAGGNKGIHGTGTVAGADGSNGTAGISYEIPFSNLL